MVYTELFTVSPVTVSPQFFGWLAALGSDVSIVRPASVREQFTAYIKDILHNYET